MKRQTERNKEGERDLRYRGSALRQSEREIQRGACRREEEIVQRERKRERVGERGRERGRERDKVTDREGKGRTRKGDR